MREEEFERYLVSDSMIASKDKAVRSRLSKARKIEVEFRVNLDEIVREDERMYETLKRIKREFTDSNGSIQNALRKYYIFVNKTKFPSLNQYEKIHAR
ncbi:hypothetical protein [Evansella cellulosilytica]|uniref:Uncharacterized protein n=1 Tax=Evansella cellulosilytica (strain ATCC 21833 / DSM 2522 / FERM P-1141 / JCM 9156 / N-4) TaxID=649639 RepID=E6TTD3_EVAC2|nr:hypothetical protein [Evansella cellulosilytica]ADU28473.1 hypothetical protein Bcell_0184 [Evansella cellulosilytica DSM 2522]